MNFYLHLSIDKQNCCPSLFQAGGWSTVTPPQRLAGCPTAKISLDITTLNMTPPKHALPTLKLRPDEGDTTQDSLYTPESGPDIDVTGSGDTFLDVPDSPAVTPVGLQQKKPTADKSQCPCGKSDPSSTKIICASCKQSWHNKCCNCVDLTSGMIKKMSRWKCPACYVCPALGMGKVPAYLFTEMRSVKETLAALVLRDNHQSSYLQKDINNLKEVVAEYIDSNVATKLELLQKEISELKKTAQHPREPELSPVLKAALDSATSVLPESVKDIQETLSQLNNKVSSLESSISNKNLSSPPPLRSPTQRPQSPSGPNTASPHLAKVETPCQPYKCYDPEAVGADIKAEVLKLVHEHSQEFTSVDGANSRQVLYFGEYSYKYTGKEHPARKLPPFLTKLLDAVAPKKDEDNTPNANSCLITKYSSGANHIPMHRDDEPVIDPESDILTISFGADRTMNFSNNDGSRSENLILQDSSLLVTTRFAQDFWKHGILPEEGVTTERISLTFRHIKPHFINSTILLGDSNTARVCFGSGSGTLGSWVPGKRVKVGHIEALPNASDIGPYRNIIIHTGINSINSRFEQRSDTYLLHVLESKCKEYMRVYPRSKIHLSLLLPTRVRELNLHVEIFNRAILDMSYRYKNVRIIDHSLFGNYLSDEYGRWSREEQRPLVTDALHLGRKGIRVFAQSIKIAAIGKGKSKSRSSFDASQGSYRRSLGRANQNR